MFYLYTFMFTMSSSSVKDQPRASCGRIAQCDPSQILFTFSSKLRKVMNMCNKIRYISNWAE